MAYTTVAPARPAAAPLAALSAGFGRVSEFVGLIGASIRIANAVENGYRPEKADLDTLGITAELPRYAPRA